jgi:hypothetical protein
LAHEASFLTKSPLARKNCKEILINVEKVRFKDVIDLRKWCGYNPLGEKKTYLVRDFILWLVNQGKWYYIEEGANDVLSKYKRDFIGIPEVLRDFPYWEEGDYIGPDLEVFRDLLREDWAEFLTKDPEVNRRFWVEYRNFEELPF